MQDKNNTALITFYCQYFSWMPAKGIFVLGCADPPLIWVARDMLRFQEVPYGNARRCLWLTLENPGYSIPSKVFSLLSISVVLTSIAAMCIHSMPEHQVGTATCYMLQHARTPGRFCYMLQHTSTIGRYCYLIQHASTPGRYCYMLHAIACLLHQVGSAICYML